MSTKNIGYSLPNGQLLKVNGECAYHDTQRNRFRPANFTGTINTNGDMIQLHLLDDNCKEFRYPRDVDLRPAFVNLEKGHTISADQKCYYKDPKTGQKVLENLLEYMKMISCKLSHQKMKRAKWSLLRM